MLNNKYFSKEEYNLIANSLENYDNIFQKFFDIGYPMFSDEIKTAAVSFDKDGNFLKFYFNKDFYDSLNVYEKTLKFLGLISRH